VGITLSGFGGDGARQIAARVAVAFRAGVSVAGMTSIAPSGPE
jgi:hypothetical protein